MAKPYSMDLRERAIWRVEAGESVRLVSAALSIAPSSVVKWCQRHRMTGGVAPGQMGGHRPATIMGDAAAWRRRRLSGSDFTLRGLVSELAGQGLKVDYRTVWSFVHGEGLSFKKRRSGQRARPT